MAFSATLAALAQSKDGLACANALPFEASNATRAIPETAHRLALRFALLGFRIMDNRPFPRFEPEVPRILARMMPTGKHIATLASAVNVALPIVALRRGGLSAIEAGLETEPVYSR
ncbi:hypothetical protein [Mesorhizobium cantuariense]|uniref:Uncharacterized protein n=1 Tax=Mesorhizobium cantuariense TaxID=1300275 RepID=A0ABV7MNW4_9HYPH